MKTVHTFKVMFLMALCLLTLGAPGRAQAPQFGVVDFQKCVDESKANQEAAVEFEKMQKSLNATLTKLSQPGAAYLSKAEITELLGLYEKPTPTDAEKKRTVELEAKADQQIGMMKRLESTNPLSEDQKKQIQSLSDAQQIGVQVLQDIQRVYQKQLEVRNAELSAKVTKSVRDMVAKIAKEKALTLVFGFDQVLYAQVDITEDVLKAVK
jgi:Skp family chaperone for outer membrane proteins